MILSKLGAALCHCWQSSGKIDAVDVAVGDGIGWCFWWQWQSSGNADADVVAVAAVGGRRRCFTRILVDAEDGWSSLHCPSGDASSRDVSHCR